jgi:topoisomerase-4 subunit B
MHQRCFLTKFKHFIGKDIRLEPVVLGKDQTIENLLEFYMGKNTPDRQMFILENLVVEEANFDKKEEINH